MQKWGTCVQEFFFTTAAEIGIFFATRASENLARKWPGQVEIMYREACPRTFPAAAVAILSHVSAAEEAIERRILDGSFSEYNNDKFR